ncbi:molecular chaperone GroEL, partial [Candidatus Poribacteria bacterium]|nr:molecular chaperone GroEL [Candidatus Poribacteria bacterium]
GGVAVINVGAATEVEMKEKKARVEDAMHATRAAVEEGIVPGGGVALVRTISALETLDSDDPSEQVGADIVRRSVEEPLRQIAKNAGQEDSVIVARVKEEGGNIGYDALRDEFGDMFQAGVIDPTKVVRVALQNASSISSLMITTEALVADIPEEAPPMPAGPPPGGGGGMGGMGGGMY